MSEIESLMNRVSKSTLLRFSTAGSVDDGKSTFIGRLLHDSKNIYEDHLRSLEKAASKLGESTPASLALVTDGLKAEQEQGITIDVAYRYFSTPTRHFILADTPGHEQYTRNMATGASTANLTIILIDARNGVVTQTKRHAFIASLLGVPRFLVAVNKMDLVGFSEEVFDRIKADFAEFASRLDIKDIRFVPISALEGDNVVEPSPRMPWYEGETVMRYLENVYIGSDTNLVDFRYPVQHVIRPNQNYRGYAGQIASGTIRVGEEITVLPSGRKSSVKSIDAWTSSGPSTLDSAHAPMSVAITLEHEIDIGRGDMIVRSSNVPAAQSQFEAMVVWMDERPLDPSRSYIIHHTTREARVHVESVRYRIDVNTLSRLPGAPLSLNEIGRLSFTSTSPLLLDPYQKNRSTGNFVLVDPDTFQTAAAGMVIDRLPHEALSAESYESLAKETSTSHHLHLEKGLITPAEREQKLGNRGVTVWCTGLSGSGKSSIAQALERELFELERPVFRLDGDNLRFGLCSDLGFSDEDRAENIRRAAEVARLFNQAGLTVICSFISPFEKDRERARQIIGKDRFIEVYMSTPLEECEKRDPHGLYRKARAGEIRGFTGIDAPYEPPRNADLMLDTSRYPLEECVRTILARLIKASPS